MKRLLSIAIVLSALFSTSAHAWFFFFLPGSVTGAISDAITGSEGENCVGPNAKVGDNIHLPNGDIKSIKSLSGTSVRCTNPTHPIRALLVPSTSTSISAPAQFQPNENISAGREAAEKQQAEYARLEVLAASNAKEEADRAAKVQAEAAAAAKTKADADVAAKEQADAEVMVEADRRAADDRQKGKSLEVKLQELKLLYTKGLISKDVYAARQHELLKVN